MNGALSVYSTRVCPQTRPEKCPHMRTKIDRQADYYLVLSCKTPWEDVMKEYNDNTNMLVWHQPLAISRG
jgi:hypothetical protein